MLSKKSKNLKTILLIATLACYFGLPRILLALKGTLSIVYIRIIITVVLLLVCVLLFLHQRENKKYVKTEPETYALQNEKPFLHFAEDILTANRFRKWSIEEFDEQKEKSVNAYEATEVKVEEFGPKPYTLQDAIERITCFDKSTGNGKKVFCFMQVDKLDEKTIHALTNSFIQSTRRKKAYPIDSFCFIYIYPKMAEAQKEKWLTPIIIGENTVPFAFDENARRLYTPMSDDMNTTEVNPRYGTPYNTVKKDFLFSINSNDNFNKVEPQVVRRTLLNGKEIDDYRL